MHAFLFVENGEHRARAIRVSVVASLVRWCSFIRKRTARCNSIVTYVCHSVTWAQRSQTLLFACQKRVSSVEHRAHLLFSVFSIRRKIHGINGGIDCVTNFSSSLNVSKTHFFCTVDCVMCNIVVFQVVVFDVVVAVIRDSHKFQSFGCGCMCLYLTLICM